MARSVVPRPWRPGDRVVGALAVQGTGAAGTVADRPADVAEVAGKAVLVVELDHRTVVVGTVDVGQLLAARTVAVSGTETSSRLPRRGHAGHLSGRSG